MIRAVACSLAVFLAILPAIDSVACPDGCTDAGRIECGWQTEASPTLDACGLCLNAVAVRCAVSPVEPVQRVTPGGSFAVFHLLSFPPRSLDRPPRSW
jgi:hypothetical protein